MNSDRKLYQRPFTWVVFSGVVFAVIVFLALTSAARAPEPVTTLEIVTKPAGATIYWNALEKGPAPKTIQSKGRLEGTLLVSMNGYRPIERQIILEAGKSQRIRYDLEFETFMKIESEPIGAKIYVDGKFWGSTPMTFDGLVSPGNHELRIDDTDYCFGEVTKKVVLEQKKNLEIKEALPKLSLVTITSNPKGAEVEANGKPWGTTPLSKCVPLGKYHLKFVKTGLVPEERDIEIKEDLSYSIHLYDLQHYALRDSYSVNADQKDATITAIALAAGDPPQVVGSPATFDKNSITVAKDEMFKKAKLDQAPFAYVFIASKPGFIPAIVQANEPGEYNLNMRSTSTAWAKLQAANTDYSSSAAPYGESLKSPDGKFTITVTDTKATLSDGTNTKELYLEKETDYSGNAFTWTPDSTAVIYFRNNKGARELVRVELADLSETVIDTINPKDFYWAKNFPADLIFQDMTSICYDSGKIYYLVPGNGQKMLTLVSKNDVGGTRNIVFKDIVPLVDKCTLWMDSPGMYKIGCVFPGSKYYEGMLDLRKSSPMSIKMETPDKVKIGNFKVLDTGMVMYEAVHCVMKNSDTMLVAVRLYAKLDGLFIYDIASGYFELAGVKAQ